MIAVDTSAIVAILFDEPEASAFEALLSKPGAFRVSALSVLEAETVVRGRMSEALVARVRQLLTLRDIQIVAFDDAQAKLASAAYARFGKGSHPARLNMGDCAAFALAQSLNAPLLYKGNDFSQTDIRSAVTSG